MSPDIMTASGRYFNFLHPHLCFLTVDEIAHALSNLCRFTGHVRWFYSVAQHAALCSYLVPREFAFQALHHDDAEAIVGDVSSPLKRLIPDYKEIEKRVETAIFDSLGLPHELDPCVKHADLVMLATEKRDLMPRPRPGSFVVLQDDDGTPYTAELSTADGPWGVLKGIEPAPLPIFPMTPTEARAFYMRRHRELTTGWRG